MKRINSIILFVLCVVAFSSQSCHKLTVEAPGFFTPVNFPSTEDQYIAAAGPVYTSFRQGIPVGYWFVQSLSTDEAILPTHAGNWFDGGQYIQLHLHTWTKDNGMTNQTWNWITTTISTCNQVLNKVLMPAPESPIKKQHIAEVRAMRALSFYMMMDLWGNIPLTTTFGDTALPGTTQRPEVFAFIEKEVKEILPDLSDVTGVPTYGRPTKYTAYALLAKMYLNAEVYTGTNRNSDAVAMCDNIISSNKFELEADYRNMFKVNNGPTTGGGKEFIMAVPYDNKYAGAQFFSRYYNHRSAEIQKKYSLPFKASGVVSTTRAYYDYFTRDVNDQRNKIWLTGKQYYFDGKPILIKTTKSGHDASYSGPDPSAPYDFHLEFTPDVIIRDMTTFDAGFDELAWAQGYRCIKYYPDSTSTNRNQSNDIPVFRYADILLMKAEAILRGATPTLGQTALSLTNDVRAKRSAAVFSSIDLEGLYEERAREFAWECWHRNDMIRFGKFEGKWDYKTDGDVNKRIFPIPSGAMSLNPKIKQNPGYN